MNAPASPATSPRALRARQLLGVFRLEVFRNFFGIRAIGIYLLAAVPVGFVTLMLLFGVGDHDITEASTTFATMFNVLIVRVLVFLGCLLVFTQAFRGEVLDRTLHYYLLVPAPRGVLTVGKFFTGAIAVGSIFALSTGLAYVLTLLTAGPGAAGDFLFRGVGLAHLATYVALTFLAVLGYGAVFLTAGLLFRTTVPLLLLAIVFWALEWWNFLLPVFLKKVSVIHYIQSLAPVAIDEGPLAVMAAPASPWFAIPGLILVAAGLLAVSTWRVRRIETHYSAE